MPFLTKSICLAAITSCVIGTCCTNLNAQTSSAPPRTSGTGGTRNPQTVPRGSIKPGSGVTKTATVPGGAPLNQRPLATDKRLPLPQAQPMRIPTLSKEMEDILVEWEQKSSKIKRLEGTFKRTTYDSVFGVEMISDGKYCFEFPDRGSFHQTGNKKGEGEKGNRFVQKPGPDERWVCDGQRIVKINDKAKEYEEIPIPEEDRGQNIRNSPLPFLFGMKAIEAKQRYAFQLNKEKTNEATIWLKVVPLTQLDSANYSRAEVILDRTNCLPLAVKLYDPTGNKEDVYLFEKKNMIVNGRTWTRWLTGIDPLKPDLRNFHKTIPPENAAKPAGQQLALPPQRSSHDRDSTHRQQDSGTVAAAYRSTAGRRRTAGASDHQETVSTVIDRSDKP